MDHHLSLHGLYVPLVTPFTGDDRLAEDALENLARAAVADGASGLVALGTTAESPALTDSEKGTVLDICAAVCRENGGTLIVGAGSNDTRGTIEDLRALGERAEVGAALVPVPYFTRPTEAGVLAHFAELSACSPVPLIVYNIPYRTGRALSVATLRGLAALPRVLGVKHAVGGIDHDTVDLLSAPDPEFAVLAGDDTFAPALLGLGAAGGITASANLRTRDFARLVSSWHSGDIVRARTLGHRLTGLVAALFAEPNPAVIKGVLYAQGRIPTPSVRLPLLAAHRESVEHALRLLDADRSNGDVDRRCFVA